MKTIIFFVLLTIIFVGRIFINYKIEKELSTINTWKLVKLEIEILFKIFQIFLLILIMFLFIQFILTGGIYISNDGKMIFEFVGLFDNSKI